MEEVGLFPIVNLLFSKRPLSVLSPKTEVGKIVARFWLLVGEKVTVGFIVDPFLIGVGVGDEVGVFVGVGTEVGAGVEAGVGVGVGVAATICTSAGFCVSPDAGLPELVYLLILSLYCPFEGKSVELGVPNLPKIVADALPVLEIEIAKYLFPLDSAYQFCPLYVSPK